MAAAAAEILHYQWI